MSDKAAPPDDLLSQVGWRATRAKLLAWDGRLDDADELADEAVRLARKTDDLNLRANAAMAQAEVLELSGASEEALATRAEAVVLYDRKGNRVAAEEARRRQAVLVPR